MIAQTRFLVILCCSLAIKYDTIQFIKEMEVMILVQKSNTGKKKRNPYRPKAKIVSAEETKRQESEAIVKKANKGWIILIAIYFIATIIAYNLEQETMPWLIAQGVGNGAMLLWGILLFTTSQHYQSRGTAGMYKIFGIILIVLSVLQLSVLFQM